MNSARNAPETRDRILTATMALLRSQGYEGTGVKQIAREAGATLGSVYHFFPQGKEQLAAEALGQDAEHYADLLRAGFTSSDDPAEGVATFAHHIADDLQASNWRDSCLVAPTALEKIGRSPVIQRIWQQSMTGWQEQIGCELREHGVEAEAAGDASHVVLSMVQGAEVICRISCDDRALRLVADHVRAYLRTVCGHTVEQPPLGAP